MLVHNAVQSAPFWIVLAEEYVPVLAAAIVTVVLARSGFQSKMSEYRRDTVDLIRLRSETLEKELADAHVEIVQLQRDLRSRERRNDMLEEDLMALRHGQGRKPPTRLRRTTRAAIPPPPLHAPDVDDPS